MSDRRNVLNVISIEQPCPADWNAMSADGSARYCEHCKKHVHDLSAMTRDQAADLICKSAGRLCVRFASDSAGRPITLDYPARIATKWPKRRWISLTMLVACIAAAANYVFFWRNQVSPLIVTPKPVVRFSMGMVTLPEDSAAGAPSQTTSTAPDRQ